MNAETPVPDKLTSPAGEEFMLADASVNRVLVKGVVAVMHARTERLWATKEGDMFLCADAEGNLDAAQATGAGGRLPCGRGRTAPSPATSTWPTRTCWRTTALSPTSRARSTSAAPGSS